ncbi:hypothetical protein C8258_08955 [Nocardia sp. MDA0666]|uniref:hypothetical protein n=1 Tax=Nocardia sp. MDA0666 TaxID=2135448 RepID=UPI000D11D1AA|nr:hypothetical protein [Nocardia sp. MDA0666]PSR68625.1 hypothetical protein C8258_08955 [Nocardia sp. MDA0666]
MSEMSAIESVLEEDSLPGRVKRQRIFDLLNVRPHLGAEVAARYLAETENEAGADYVAQYLALIPGMTAEKTRAAERLRRSQALTGAASWLVPWLPDDLLDAFITDYLTASEPSESPARSVVYCIGLFHPQLLRPYGNRLEPLMVRALLSGGPDELADAFLELWEQTHTLPKLEALALIRTDHARELVRSARDTVDEPSDWTLLMQLAGTLPDTGQPSGFWPACMGFIADRQQSPHTVGGLFHGEVPVCLACGTPAEQVLKLAADSLPFALKNDPSFFWYTCGCYSLESTTLRITPEGTHVYYGPSAPATDSTAMVPGGERSLVLEHHPNQTGISDESTDESNQHQVGGLPNWITVDRHPRCPECGNYMPFLASIGGNLTPFGNLAFDGTLYGFWCDDCCVSSTKYQS